jgi:hypothetical protein
MPVDVKSLKVNVAAAIKTLTGKNVAWMNQNSNTPAGDFLFLKISSFRMVGFTDYESKPYLKPETEDTYITDTQGDREFVLSIQAISVNSMEILLDLVNKLNLNFGLSILKSKKLAYVDMDGDIADITTMINGNFENRASVDLIFRISKNYSSANEIETGIVESVGIQGELDGNGLEDPVEIDLTVTS